MKKALTILLLAASFFSCKKTYEVLQPDYATWALFKNPAAIRINTSARNAMEGVYNLKTGTDVFGELVAVKWSYAIRGGDTSFHVSGFFGKDVAWFICEGKRLGDSILLNGYWRKMVNVETGIMRFVINQANGANKILSANPIIDSGSITMDGVFGAGQDEPKVAISFTYDRKLNKSPAPFEILAHRGGGRTSDLLQVSENSVNIILKTPEFGSTGIEIDVRFTKDGVPILYHDNDLNLRVVQKSGLVGPIENYTYDQLTAFVRLVNGEKIPTLREALNAVLYQTGLTFVWLDTKYIGSLAPVQAIQKEFLQKAAAAGRNLKIVIGLPGKDQYFSFLELPDYLNTPSLCELSIEEAATTNSIWAPRFTEGLQADKVAQVQAQGRRVFSWTVDVPDFVTQFVQKGNFDGVLSNFPSSVAFNYYTNE